MSVLKINDFSILEKTSAYSITKQDLTKEFESQSGDITQYVMRTGRYQIELEIICKGDFYSQLENILLDSELTVNFTYANAEHTAVMIKKSYKSSCITLNDAEYWNISLSLQESRR